MIRREVQNTFLDLIEQYPVVMLTGPRQSGKTTLCRATLPHMAYVSLESPDHRTYALDDPRGFLGQYREGVIIDEAQRAPELFSYIQGIVDAQNRAGQFILTGSQNFQLANQISQSLAGRAAIVKLLPFSMHEIAEQVRQMTLDTLLVHGFYPRIYDQHLAPYQALSFYFETYVERDVRSLMRLKDLSLFQKFVRLCAGRIGQLLNLSNLGNEAGVSHTTAREWLSLLEASYIVFVLPPHHENYNKRITKSPKLYFCDVGLAAYLLGIESVAQMQRDPLRAHLFENLIVLELLKRRYAAVKPSNLSFFRDANRNEVDVIQTTGHDLTAIEIKSGQTITPDFFKGLQYFSRLVSREHLTQVVVYGGTDLQRRSDVTVYPYTHCAALAGHEGAGG